MSQTMSYLPIKDFPVIRISCYHTGCGMVLELPPKRIEEAMSQTKGCCPLCGKPFINPEVEGGANVIVNLAKVVLALNKLAPQVGIYLPIPVQE